MECVCQRLIALTKCFHTATPQTIGMSSVTTFPRPAQTWSQDSDNGISFSTWALTARLTLLFFGPGIVIFPKVEPVTIHQATPRIPLIRPVCKWFVHSISISSSSQSAAVVFIRHIATSESESEIDLRSFLFRIHFRQPITLSEFNLLIHHVQQASLRPWQQHKPYKPTAAAASKQRCSSQPQQHIITHHIQPIAARSTHPPTGGTSITFTRNKYGSKRVCSPVKPGSR
jgi:hypothetical protein